MDGENKDRECDEVTCVRWGELGSSWTGWGHYEVFVSKLP